APLRVGTQSAAIDDTPIETPLVFPGAPAFAVVPDSPDSLNHTVGTPLESIWSRLASAWSLQSIAIVTRPLPQPRPTLISRRDILRPRDEAPTIFQSSCRACKRRPSRFHQPMTRGWCGDC